MPDTWLITLTPLEPWFFGTERTLGFRNNSAAKRAEALRRDDPEVMYLIHSATLPTQTTLLGMLRKHLLDIHGLTKPLGSYTQADHDELRKLIGPESFRMQSYCQDFGAIHALSPLLLFDGDRFYVPRPWDHEPGITEYRSIQLTQIEGTKSNLPGNSHAVSLSSFTYKNGLSKGFVEINTDGQLGAVMDEDEIFNRQMQVGIQKSARTEGFFKKECVSFAPRSSDPARRSSQMRMAFFASLDLKKKQPGGIVTMGQDRSAFRLVGKPAQDLALSTRLLDSEPQVQAPPSNRCALLSDAWVNRSLYDHCRFALSDARPFRHLTTDIRAKSYYEGMTTSENRMNLLSAGSVLYVKPGCQADVEKLISIPNLRKIGMNHCLWLEGTP